MRVRRHAQPPTEHPQVGKERLLHARPCRLKKKYMALKRKYKEWLLHARPCRLKKKYMALKREDKERLLHGAPCRRGAAVGVDGTRPATVRLLAC